MSGKELASVLEFVPLDSLESMLEREALAQELHQRQEELKKGEAAVEAYKREVEQWWQEVQREREKLQLDREELEQRVAKMARPLLVDTMGELRKEREKVRTLEAEKKARELTVAERFGVLKKACENGELIEVVVVGGGNVKDEHFKDDMVWVMIDPFGERSLRHLVRFEVAFQLDGVPVRGPLLGSTFKEWKNACGLLFLRLKKKDGCKDDCKDYYVVQAQRQSEEEWQRKDSKRKEWQQSKKEAQSDRGGAVAVAAIANGNDNVPPRNVGVIAGAVEPDAEAVAQIARGSVKSKKELMKKQKKREAPTDESPLQVHGFVEEDAARKQHRQADMVVFLLPEKWDLTVFEPCTLVAIVSANGQLFPTTQPRLDHNVVCWTVTADPRGVCKGHFKPWMCAFPDGFAEGGQRGLPVVLAGLVLVKVTDDRVVISSDKTLYCDGHVVGKVVQVSNIEPAPFGYVYAYVGSLLDAVNARRVPRRYVQYLAHEPLEIQQVGVMAAKLGQLDAVKQCREILYDSVVMCSSLSRGFRLYRAAIREMLGASLLQAEVFTYLCDYADLATIKVVALMLSEVVAEPEPATIAAPAWSRA
jgi:uncharacterized membrane-anchored protein YhcB (DUF1043 family)